MLPNKHQKHRNNPRLIHLSGGRGILIHRTAAAVMGMVGPVDKWETVGVLSHYRFYTLEADGRITRKIRQAVR